MKRGLVIMIAALIVVLLGLFIGVSLTGYAINIFEKRESCTASFGGMSVEVAPMYAKSKLARGECVAAYSQKNSLIVRQVCVNSDGLGDVTFSWGKELLNRFPLVCPESLADEDPEIPVTMEGTFYPVISENFDTKTEKFSSSIKEKYSDKIYDLKVEGMGDDILNNKFKSGDKIKLRAKKTDSILTLSSDDETVIVKTGGLQ